MCLVGAKEDRQEGAAAVDDAPHVDVHDPVQVLEGLVREASGAGHPGVVDEDVAAAVLVDDLVGDGFEPFLVAYVSDVHRSASAVGADEVCRLRGPGLVGVDDRDVGAASGEGFAGRASDAASGPGDGGDSIDERPHARVGSVSTQRVPV